MDSGCVSPKAQLAQWFEAVRKRPEMYFGCSGSEAIPRIILGLVERIVNELPRTYSGPIDLGVAGHGDRQTISIFCAGLASRSFNPSKVGEWPAQLRKLWEFGAAAAASAKFTLESACGGSRSRLEIQESGRFEPRRLSAPRAPFLRITFEPAVKTFGRLGHDGFYRIAGGLRDFSFLRRGLATSFSADALKGKLSYYYEKGIQSLLFEEEHQRWSLHSRCLGFRGTTKGMQVEGCVRFLHAGVPRVRNFVNYHETQGGAHLLGLGAALQDMFPDPSRGCRELPFVMNPDNESTIYLPHSFIGAMHLRMKNPRYAGSTRDVLIGDDVRDFVHQAARQLKPQWERAYRQRF